MTNQTGSSKLRPRARLINLIGEELISDEPVAVVELVKNSYDADASHVTVRFSDLNGGGLIVEDDGHGMDLDTVLNIWFEPGTISKRKRGQSPRGRIYQGAKGIGRFASARIAESLFLESRSNPEGTGVKVLFEWGDFNDDSYLDEIEVIWEQGNVSNLEQGTRLTLASLRKNWTESDFAELHSRLSRLISPFQEVTDFTIELQIPGFPNLSGNVQPPDLLELPRYQLEGTVSASGFFDGQLMVNGEFQSKIQDKKLGDEGQIPLCGPFSTEIRVWDRDREGLDPLVTRLNQSISQLRGTLNNYSGVSIYRDGFRVYPYGQSGNDWLQLDNRSRQNPAMRLANNQIVAAIKISRDTNPDLNDRSTREGLVMNEAYRDLESWFIEVLKEIELERYRSRPRQKTDLQRESLFEAFDIRETVKQTRSALGKEHEVTALIVQLEQQVNEGVERIQEVFSRLLMSAGLGQMVDLVIHEIGAPIGKINRQLILLEREIDASSDLSMASSVGEMIDKIRVWLEQLHSLRQRLDPQIAGKRGRATSFDVRDEIEDTFRLYENILANQMVTWEIDSPTEPVKVHMARSALGQVLVNLVDNAIFWIIRSRGSKHGGHIKVQLEHREGGFAIQVSDNGPGITSKDTKDIFEPYFTRKPNGIGLGLYIARLVIEPYGRLILLDEGPLSGACFEAVFEHGVGI